MAETVAFVGAAGGVGTTRLTLNCGRLLAAEGFDTAILDAAYGTQGLSDHVSGRLKPDMTELCLNETPLLDGVVDLSITGAGRCSVCPAHAPFERIARAKTPDAAERFGQRIEEATRHFEYVLIDTPPVATNPSVAAVTTAETVAVVCDGDRAAAAIPRTEDRLADIGTQSSATVLTRTSAHPDADVTVPTLEMEPADTSEAIAAVLTSTIGVSIEPTAESGFFDFSFR